MNHDPVSHPSHYTTHPSGIECIDVTEHMNFCRGNAMKYLWRAGSKGDEVEDLRKARWYINRELLRLRRESADNDIDRVSAWIDALDAVEVPQLTDERLQQIAARLLEAINDARENVAE